MYIIGAYDRHLDCTIYFVRKDRNCVHYTTDREKAARFINSVEAEQAIIDLLSLTFYFLEEVSC